jgi:hypothetical protein
VLAGREQKIGDICVTANSHETKSLLKSEEEWTLVIVGQTKVKDRLFTVMAHGVWTNRINVKNQQKALADLQAQSP